MSLIDCEINLILTWFAHCLIIDDSVNNQEPTFALTDAKRYVPIVTLSTEGNVKLLQQVISGYRRAIEWNN